MSKNRELVKNDPDYHDIRAKILLEAAQHINKYTKENFVGERSILMAGLQEAAAELRRMASNARRAHKKVQDERRASDRDSEEKAKAKAFFGF